MPSSRSARTMSQVRLPSCSVRMVRAVCDCGPGALPMAKSLSAPGDASRTTAPAASTMAPRSSRDPRLPLEASRAQRDTSGSCSSSDARVSLSARPTFSHDVVERLTPTLRSIFGVAFSMRRTVRSFSA